MVTLSQILLPLRHSHPQKLPFLLFHQFVIFAFQLRFEVVHEVVVLDREDPGLRVEVKQLRKASSHFVEVSGQQVLSVDIVHSWEVVDLLVRCQPLHSIAVGSLMAFFRSFDRIFGFFAEKSFFGI